MLIHVSSRYKFIYKFLWSKYEIFLWSFHKDLLQLRELNNAYPTSKLGWPETFLFSTIVKPRFCISLLVLLRTLPSPTSLQEKQLSNLFLMLVTSVLLFWTLTWQWDHILTTSLVLLHLLWRRSAVSENILIDSPVKNSFMLCYLLALTIIVIVYSSTSDKDFANFNESKTHLPTLSKFFCLHTKLFAVWHLLTCLTLYILMFLQEH